MHEGQGVGIARLRRGGERRLVHQSPDGEVSQQEPVCLLAHQLGGLAPKDDARPAQMGLEFIERPFDLPALVIERGQLGRWRRGGIEQRRHQAIRRLGVGDAGQRVLEHADGIGVRSVARQ